MWLRIVVVLVCRSEAQREGAVIVSWRGGPGISDLLLRHPANWRCLANKDPGEYPSSSTNLLTNILLPMALVILS